MLFENFYNKKRIFMIVLYYEDSTISVRKEGNFLTKQ